MDYRPLIEKYPELDATIEQTLEWWTEDKYSDWSLCQVDKDGHETLCALGALGYQIDGSKDAESIRHIVDAILVPRTMTTEPIRMRGFLRALGQGRDLAYTNNMKGHAEAVAQLKLIAENFRREKEALFADS